jgi:UDP:flavonoid glycosyltransferase YjiC (YdhE family)
VRIVLSTTLNGQGARKNQGSPLTALFLPSPSASGTWGSTLYLLAIADACRARGHRPIFHLSEPTRSYVERSGFETVGFEGVPLRVHFAPIRDLYAVVRALGLDDRQSWEQLLKEEADAIENVEPDVVVADFRFTAMISAQRAKLPVVALAMWATDPRHHGRGDDPLDVMARGFSAKWRGPEVVTFPELIFWHADQKIATSFPAFEPELKDVSDLSYVGYLDRSFEAENAFRVDPLSRPLVVGYLSTAGWATERIVRSIARTIEEIGGTFWCVARADTEPAKVSRHFEIFSYLPFDRVLPQADAVIFHGGQGTAMASLSYGVPSIVVPGDHYERQYTARRLMGLRAAIGAEIPDLRPSRFRTLLREILGDRRYERGAEDARQVLQQFGGAVAAAGIVEAAAEPTVPPPPPSVARTHVGG